ncbi:TIGR03752 family integrating conjugative element protein [Delftia acidovorans]|uniref:TIGR03752 family integrating conjugative element protein n=1 Tax=Delftia acidovorans TaxID=80866 RepID=A0AAJ2VDQ0_DELAC|nr:TIGR03752 family integrating conjugative element protein [Delftia acidovorans]MDX4957812.1 TIGR03752 family integrating conjugative element protein [Delftia acidovorans]
MAVPRNKLIPLLGALTLAGVVSIFFMGRSAPPAAAPMAAVPLPATAGADEDTAAETLATVAASNRELRTDIQKVIQANEQLASENREMQQRMTMNGAPAAASSSPSAPATNTGSGQPGTGPVDVIANAWGNASDAFGNIGGPRPAGASQPPLQGSYGTGAGSAFDMGSGSGYEVLAPMGYTKQTSTANGKSTTRYVRAPGAAEVAPGPAGQGGSAMRAAQAAAAVKPEPEPYYTLPENSTLAGVTAMTSLIGRVPVNGRVTDPMQFKAMVGRDNLAANGWELPEDLAGMIITGVAIGDMALSCTEGKVRSMTFVFDDGAIRTVSARRSGSSTSGGLSSASNADLGFISDLHGNPCIQGRFVTNAPTYLTDIIGAKGLGVAAEALAQAQTTTLNRGDSTSASVTGNAGSFALGRMGSAATEELTRWLTERLKSSFDAVVTPSGAQLVVHLDREIQIDKPVNPRKVVHRTQATNALSGARYGLE